MIARMWMSLFYKFDLKADGVVDCQMQDENYALSRIEYVNFSYLI